ncbi:response regulator transcription factor [Cetobacterium sp. SF1]|uniref:response regulator transcription factor n=1 Tax=Cetobacterium sp. SF1 TaxID=3417654 RepID=UPI003CF2D1E9
MEKNKKILIIEDDTKIQRYLFLELTHENYIVDVVDNGIEGLNKLNENEYSLILLDLMLPNISGEEVCKKIREQSNIPIIILTAKDELFSKISLLDLGADDYITKPFNIQELFARMRVIFRNKKDVINKNFLGFKNIKINLDTKEVFFNEELIKLTKTEYNLLHYLLLNSNIVLSREKILENVWGYDFIGDSKIVDMYIKALRKKLNCNNDIIKTVRGFGYTLQ